MLMLSPTGKVATRHLSAPGVTSMTLARLLAMEHVESMAAFAGTHAAWVVCELGTVSKTDWEQVYYLWKACDCWPTLVAEGDFAQLSPPVADWKAVDCRLSPTLQWHRAYQLQGQHRCEDPQSLGFLNSVRTAPPCLADVQDVLGACVVEAPLSDALLRQFWQAHPGAPVLRHLGQQVPNAHALLSLSI